MYLNTHMWVWRTLVSSSITLYFVFVSFCLWDKISYRLWTSPTQVGWLGSVLQGSIYLLLSTGLQMYSATSDFLDGYWGSKHRFSCFIKQAFYLITHFSTPEVICYSSYRVLMQQQVDLFLIFISLWMD